ncbi:hypothetical protein PROFUN_12857 [Planoprotostelium fungivorum]|uniref:Uncharacterized protein n=1 Tax=Planoprotostelium fungivorum TaxID=1890364 RepID=A0A2P6N6B1_9EUKA|nr:hypothetical protein PROFUN_12857 [Planoprotostelium fungivorum]
MSCQWPLAYIDSRVFVTSSGLHTWGKVRRALAKSFDRNTVLIRSPRSHVSIKVHGHTAPPFFYAEGGAQRFSKEYTKPNDITLIAFRILRSLHLRAWNDLSNTHVGIRSRGSCPLGATKSPSPAYFCNLSNIPNIGATT